MFTLYLIVFVSIISNKTRDTGCFKALCPDGLSREITQETRLLPRYKRSFNRTWQTTLHDSVTSAQGVRLSSVSLLPWPGSIWFASQPKLTNHRRGNVLKNSPAEQENQKNIRLDLVTLTWRGLSYNRCFRAWGREKKKKPDQMWQKVLIKTQRMRPTKFLFL